MSSTHLGVDESEHVIVSEDDSVTMMDVRLSRYDRAVYVHLIAINQTKARK
jgi:hypothetical protein